MSIEENNNKALFRRSQAYLGLGDYELALVDLKKLHAADPDNAEFIREIEQVNKAMKNYLEKEKNTFKRMFQ